jgi:hypothetical protein
LNQRISAALAHPAVMRAAPFAIFVVFIAVSSLLPETDSQQAARDLRWLDVLRAATVTAALIFFWRGYGELAVASDVKPHWWLLAIGCGLAVFVMWIHFDDGWAVLGRIEGFDPTGADGEIRLTLAGLRLAESVLVVPVMEELFWRSFLLRWLDARDFIAADPRRASPRAFALTAVLFASEHSLWFAGLIAGLLYNWLYIRTGNLWVAIASHAMTNGALGIWILATGNWRLW